MNWKSFTKWAGLALVAGLGACSSDPEDFCVSWSNQVCTVLTDCCESGQSFDEEECQLSLTGTCQDNLRIEKVHSGEVVFNGGAASTCFGTLATCDDLAVQDNSFERVRACALAITGFRPPGSACDNDDQCEAAGGEYPVCYGNTGFSGVCALIVRSGDGSCGFSLDTNFVTTCPVDQWCDTSEYTVDPNTPPVNAALEVKGTCRDQRVEGEGCYDADKGQPIPCETGLYCEVPPGGDLGAAKCAPLRGEGETCDGGNCKPGLVCTNVDPMTPDLTCQKIEVTGPYCYQPPECGNNVCESPFESADNCDQDCGANQDCGDGVCDFANNEAATCPDDCCGDGFCDPGEDAVCPADCN